MANYSHSYPVTNAIRKYESHPSLKKISKTINITSTFQFNSKSIGNLNFSKVGTFKNIPTNCLKVTSDI